MAKTAGVRVTSIKVSLNDNIFSNYSSGNIMQICRSAKQRTEKKNVPFSKNGLDGLFVFVMDYVHKNGPICDHCKKTFQRKDDGKGGGGPDSLSLHRVIASRGYIESNLKVICQACNVAIGEIQNMDDIAARMNALVWQTKLMEGG